MSVMKRFVSAISVATLFWSGTAALGQVDRNTTQLSATATVRDLGSPEAQIKEALRIIDSTPPDASQQQRFDAFSAARANLEFVRTRWSSNSTAVLNSAMLSANLCLQWAATKEAVRVLTSVEQRAKGTVYEATLERTLAEAQMLGRDTGAAEEHLRLAEKALTERSTLVERMAVLADFAAFYAKTGQPREAITRYTRLAALPGISVIDELTFRVSAAEEALRLADDPDHAMAREQLGILDTSIAKARSRTLSPADATIVNDIGAHAANLRARNHL